MEEKRIEDGEKRKEERNLRLAMSKN